MCHIAMNGSGEVAQTYRTRFERVQATMDRMASGDLPVRGSVATPDQVEAFLGTPRPSVRDV